MDLGSVSPARVRLLTRADAMRLQDLAAETVTAPFRPPELFDPPSDCEITEATDIWYIWNLTKVTGMYTIQYGLRRAAMYFLAYFSWWEHDSGF